MGRKGRPKKKKILPKIRYKVGDIVNIIESKPYSKKKRWEVRVAK